MQHVVRHIRRKGEKNKEEGSSEAETEVGQEENLTGSVHWKIEVLNLAEAPKYLAKVVLRDILGQFLYHNLGRPIVSSRSVFERFRYPLWHSLGGSQDWAFCCNLGSGTADHLYCGCEIEIDSAVRIAYDFERGRDRAMDS